MIHETEVKKYKGTLEELAEDVGNLRYDALSKFLELLYTKLYNDSENDLKRNRKILSNYLYLSVKPLIESKLQIDKAWNLCKNYIKKEKDNG